VSSKQENNREKNPIKAGDTRVDIRRERQTADIYKNKRDMVKFGNGNIGL